jgi:hypothetical protein
VPLCAKAALDNNRAADTIKNFLMDVSLVCIGIGLTIPPATVPFLQGVWPEKKKYETILIVVRNQAR